MIIKMMVIQGKIYKITKHFVNKNKYLKILNTNFTWKIPYFHGPFVVSDRTCKLQFTMLDLNWMKNIVFFYQT